MKTPSSCAQWFSSGDLHWSCVSGVSWVKMSHPVSSDEVYPGDDTYNSDSSQSNKHKFDSSWGDKRNSSLEGSGDGVKSTQPEGAPFSSL